MGEELWSLHAVRMELCRYAQWTKLCMRSQQRCVVVLSRDTAPTDFIRRCASSIQSAMACNWIEYWGLHNFIFFSMRLAVQGTPRCKFWRSGVWCTMYRCIHSVDNRMTRDRFMLSAILMHYLLLSVSYDARSLSLYLSFLVLWCTKISNISDCLMSLMRCVLFSAGRAEHQRTHK